MVTRADYLPYRCPKCGDQRNFHTLQELRIHLEVEHPISTSHGGWGRELIDSYHKDAADLEARLRKAKELEKQNKQLLKSINRSGKNQISNTHDIANGREKRDQLKESSPTSIPGASYLPSKGPKNRHDKRKSLKLRNSLDSERANRARNRLEELLRSPEVSPDKSFNGILRASPELPTAYNKNLNGMRNLALSDSNLNNPSLTTSALYSIPSSDLKESLYNDLIQPHDLERKQSHISGMADALLQARSHIDSLKETADKVTTEQQQAINKLKQDLKIKDHQLEKAKKELYKLTADRRRLQREVVDLSKSREGDTNQVKQLKNQLQNNTQLVADKEKEVDDLAKYLSLVAQKELQAKSELEEFIASLLQRAQQAEEQLQNLQAPLLVSNSLPSNALNTKTALTSQSQYSPNLLRSNQAGSSLNGGGTLNQPVGGGLSPQELGGTYAVEATPVYESRDYTNGYDSDQDLHSDENGIIWDDQLDKTYTIAARSESSTYRSKSHDNKSSNHKISPRSYDNLAANRSPPRSHDYKSAKQRNETMTPALGNNLSDWYDENPGELQANIRKSQRIPTPDWNSENRQNSSRPNNDKKKNMHNVPLTHDSQRMRDALFCVCMFVDTKTLCKMARVCKEWRDITHHPALWRRVVLQHDRMSSKFLKTMSKWCTQLQSLTLEGLRGRARRLNETEQDYNRSTRGSLESGLEYIFSIAQYTLVSLRIVDCGNLLTDRIIWLAGSRTRCLQRLAYISNTHPLGPEAVWALAAGCRDLTTLIVPPSYPCAHPERFNNKSIAMIAKCWPGLKVLCVGGPEISIKGLTTVAKYCQRLQILELDHMCEVTEAVAMAMSKEGLRGLECLDFTFTPVTPKALLHFVSACPHLRVINVHIGISDYFQDTSNPNHQQQYQLIVSKLQSVQRRPGFGDIIRLKTDY